MKHLSIRLLAGPCLVLGLALFLAGCSQPLTVEQQIIATIRNMEAQIENGERRAFMESIAEDFDGRSGRMNREQLHAFVVFQLNRHKRLQAQLFPIDVDEVQPGQATATFRALVTGGPKWFPESGQVYDFVTHWRQAGDEWMLTAADWDAVYLEEALQDVL